jgi:type VI secretion system secreted protein Hcp
MLDAHLTIIGERQGSILVPGGAADLECRVYFISHQIVAPRIPGTGLTTGQRYHKPLSLRRDVSAASIALQEAFGKQETLTEVTLECYQATPLGLPQQTYTLQLFDAHIVSLRVVLPYTRRGSRVRPAALQEEISFTYRCVQWTWNHPVHTASDDWLIAR